MKSKCFEFFGGETLALTPRRSVACQAAALAFAVAFSSIGFARDQEPQPVERTQQLKGLEAIQVPEGFTVELAAGPEMAAYPMLAAFDDRGRLFVCESSGKDLSGQAMVDEPECQILLLEDTNGDGVFDQSKHFADHLGLPMGVLWRDGALYVAAAPDLLRFEDDDGDGVADRREVILTGWKVLNTASLHGPFFGPDGWLYLTHGRHGYEIETKEGEKLEGQAARIWRCRPDGTGLERVCGGGFDNPVELIFTPECETIGTMTYYTNPRNGQRDSLMHFVQGGVYPKVHDVLSEFKRTGDLMEPVTIFARVAPAGLALYRGLNFGASYRGDLFSAQFNPHRVQRHVLSRKGATFATVDSDFLTSTDPDFHACDVLEDADGSLLVIDTGGWYVDACPISRIARPEIKGSIYRVRKTEAETVEDPWGRGLDFPKMEIHECASLLADRRPEVRDRAREELVSRGAKSVEALSEVLNQNDDAEARVGALWALHRIDTPPARSEVRAALGQDNPLIRRAACHAEAMARDAEAVPDLIQLLGDADPAVRRMAAAALGRIDARGAAKALLAAAAHAEDRWIEHSIIDALIRIDAREQALEALGSDAPLTRKAALIALDQIGDSVLKPEQLRPFLVETDANLRAAGLWVASHHPDWAVEVVDYLRSRLLAEDFDPDEAEPLREAVLAFAAEQPVIDLIAELLAQTSLDAVRRVFLLETIGRSSFDDLPKSWIARLGDQLDYPAPEVRWQTLALIRSRKITAWDGKLALIARDARLPDSVRVAARSAILARWPTLDAEGFQFLQSTLAPDFDPALRLSAADLIAHAELRPDQLKTLAEDDLSKADALTLPKLIGAFEQTEDEEAGRALVQALNAATFDLGILGPDRLENLIKRFPAPVVESAAPLLESLESGIRERTERLLELEPDLAHGDVGRGRSIFFGERTACSTCHSIGADGGNLGPDLTSIGSIRSGRDLLEAVLFPSASFVPGYEPYRIDTQEESYAGVIARQSPEALNVKTGADAEVRIPRSAIVSMTPSIISTMPEGLDTELTRGELIDLMTFLLAQNGSGFLEPTVASSQSK